MSKKSALIAFAAGTLAGLVLSKVHVVVAISKKTPVDAAPAPKELAVPRPGHPRPQMQAQGQTPRPKRYR